jgi:hypothetical protein
LNKINNNAILCINHPELDGFIRPFVKSKQQLIEYIEKLDIATKGLPPQNNIFSQVRQFN